MAASPATAGEPGVIPPLLSAGEDVLKVTRYGTAQVAIRLINDSGSSGELQADDTVTNPGGRKLPSGVGFRRAFIELQVLDAQGRPIWASGHSNRASSHRRRTPLMQRAKQPWHQLSGSGRFSRAQRENPVPLGQNTRRISPDPVALDHNGGRAYRQHSAWDQGTFEDLVRHLL